MVKANPPHVARPEAMVRIWAAAAAGLVESMPQGTLAQSLAETGAARLVDEYDICRAPNALAEFRRLPIGAWRSYGSADSLHFYALRLWKAGLITSTPTEVSQRGTNLNFIDVLKREAKT